MKSDSHSPKGSCTKRVSKEQWPCRPQGHQVETEMTLAEIVENDEPLSETIGQIHLLKMMTTMRNTRGAPTRR